MVDRIIRSTSLSIINLKGLFFLILSSFFFPCCFHCKAYLEEEIKPFDVNGVITSKTKTKVGCFGEIKLHGTGHLSNLDLCYCVTSNEKLWDDSLIGDSLVKQGGSLKVQLYRNGTLFNIYNYPCCDQ